MKIFPKKYPAVHFHSEDAVRPLPGLCREEWKNPPMPLLWSGVRSALDCRQGETPWSSHTTPELSARSMWEPYPSGSQCWAPEFGGCEAQPLGYP